MTLEQRKKLYTEGLVSWHYSPRDVLPWRRNAFSPEQVLITEMLLRKTKAESVAPVVEKLQLAFPNLAFLAAASVEDVEPIVRPLGLQRIRARALIDVANILLIDNGGRVPADMDYLLHLPHVGRYVANATLIFGFNMRRPLVDANIVRVFARHFGTERPIEVHKSEPLWSLATDVTPQHDVQRFWWSALDHGSFICKPKNPQCTICPVSTSCLAYNTLGEQLTP